MRIIRPLAGLAAAAALIVPVGLASAPAQAASTYDPTPTKSGAAWLSDQVTDGLVHNEQYDFDDVGLSIDVALGLDAAGKKPTVVKAITKAVAKNVAFYTAFAPSVYAGPTAKAAVLALSQDKDPHAFGGVDLVAQLEGRVATAAPITGRIEDAFDPNDEFGGDFANVIGQAYAAQALSLVGSAKASSATAFLLQQQCDKGYFRQYFTADKTRTDQSCQGAPRAERGASTDATALAVLALQDVKGAQGQGGREEGRRLARGHASWATAAFTDTGKATACVQHQQHRPGRLGARRGRRHDAGRAGRRRGARPAGRGRQPVHRKVGEARRCHRLRLRRADDRRGARASPRRPATSGVGHRRRPCRCCAGRLGAEVDLTVTAPRHRAPSASRCKIRLTGVAAGERVCGHGARARARVWPGRNPITPGDGRLRRGRQPHATRSGLGTPAPRRRGAGHELTVSSVRLRSAVAVLVTAAAGGLGCLVAPAAAPRVRGSLPRQRRGHRRRRVRRPGRRHEHRLRRRGRRTDRRPAARRTPATR